MDSGIIYDNPSIVGRNITGRSLPSYDIHKPYSMPGMMVQTAGNFPTQKNLSISWGTFVAGVVVGGIVTLLLVTSTGRGLLGAAGERTTRYVRGR
jgi:hypothetical protein